MAGAGKKRLKKVIKKNLIGLIGLIGGASTPLPLRAAPRVKGFDKLVKSLMFPIGLDL